MRFTLFIFLLGCAKIVLAQDFGVFRINEEMLNSDTMIVYPVVSNCKGADAINKSVMKNLLEILSYVDSAEAAGNDNWVIKSDLYRLVFRVLNTDTTVSFIFKLIKGNEKMEVLMRSYLTFSIQTGIQLSIYDLFPAHKKTDITNFIDHHSYHYTINLRHQLFQRFKKGELTEQQFNILDFRLMEMCLFVISDSFAATDRTIYLQYKCLIPPEVSDYVSDELRIDVPWMLYMLSSN